MMVGVVAAALARGGGLPMPLYTYKCDDCGEVFDKLARYYDDAVNQICGCSGVATRIAFYAPHIQVGDVEVPRDDPEWRDAAKKKLKKERDWDYDRSLEHIRNHVVDTDQGKVLDTGAM